MQKKVAASYFKHIRRVANVSVIVCVTVCLTICYVMCSRLSQLPVKFLNPHHMFA